VCGGYREGEGSGWVSEGAKERGTGIAAGDGELERGSQRARAKTTELAKRKRDARQEDTKGSERERGTDRRP
jgi:hypothetical protein